jgi:hypothetical protein
MAANHQKVERELHQILCSHPQGGQLCWHTDIRLPASRTLRDQVSVAYVHILSFWQQPKQTDTDGKRDIPLINKVGSEENYRCSMAAREITSSATRALLWERR